MKKNRGLLVLVGLVILAGGYAYWDHRADLAAAKEKEQKSLVVQLKVDQIQSVRIQSEAGEVLLERQDDGWHITKPIQDLAKPTAIDEFVEGLMTEKITGTAIESAQPDLAPFGLDQPKATVELKDNLGKSTIIAIGRAKNFQGDAYLRIDQEPRVVMASSTWFAKAEKKLDDFRDKRFLRFPVANVLKLQIQNLNERFLLSTKKGAEGEPDQWFSSAHPDWKLDQNKVREFLRQLNTNEGIEIAIDRPPTSPEMKSWGLAKPFLVLSADLKDGKSWTAHFAAGADKIHRVHTSHPEWTMKISPTDSDRYAKTTEDAFRDRTEAFRFDRTHVKSAEITLGNKKYSLKDMENEKVHKFLKTLSEMSLAQFTSQADYKDLNKEIVLKNMKDEVIFRLQWGILKKVKIQNEDVSVFEAKSSLSPNVFTVMEADINDLKLDDLDPQKPAAQQEKK